MRKSTIIAICNQKGSVTKTTTAVILGTGLVRQCNKVLLVDADPQGDFHIKIKLFAHMFSQQPSNHTLTQ